MVNVRDRSKLDKKYQPYVARWQRQKAEMRSRLKKRHQAGIAHAKDLAGILKSEFGATKVVLFGSTLSARSFNLRSDIDLAVWGLPYKDYMAALSKLFFQSKAFDVDLIRIEEASDSLKDCILKEGVTIGEDFPGNKISLERQRFGMGYGTLISRIRRIVKDLEVQSEYAQQQVKVTRETGQSAYWNDVAYSLHGFYTGLEKVFNQIAREVDEGLDRQDSGWHKALLEQMLVENIGVRPAVISEEVYQYLDDYLKFRHVVRSHYTHRLDPERIDERMKAFPDCYALVVQELEDFCQFLTSAE